MNAFTPKIIAHRGASGLAPENTLTAIRTAIALNADGIECDVWLSQDGHVVVHHDYSLSPNVARLDGKWLQAPGPAICSLPLSQIKTYDIGRYKPNSHRSTRYPNYRPIDGEKVPTLKEILYLLSNEAPKTFEIWVEIKVNENEEESLLKVPSLVELTINDLRQFDFLSRATIISFYWPALSLVRAASRTTRLGFLTPEHHRLGNFYQLKTTGIPQANHLKSNNFSNSISTIIKYLGGKIWSAYYKHLAPQHLSDARAHGLEVCVWTIRNKRQKTIVDKLRPDFITTDRPDWYTYQSHLTPQRKVK